MTTLAHCLVVLSSVWLIGVSLFMMTKPQTALVYLGKMASTNLINYTEITIRIIVGIAFVVFASHSRFPMMLEVFGWILVVTSLVLYFIPRKWHSAYAVFWSKKLTPLMTRLAGLIGLAAGIFLLYAAI